MAQEIITQDLINHATKLANRQNNATPFLLLDCDEMLNRVRLLLDQTQQYFARSRLFYSYKTNNLAYVMQKFAASGLGAEVASLEELRSAQEDGTANNGTIFDGPLKLSHELEYAMRSDTIIHLDSLHEAREAARILAILGSANKAKFGLRLAHQYENQFSRFGFTPNELEDFLSCDQCGQLKIEGVHIHAGSNLGSIDAFRNCFIQHWDYITKIIESPSSWIDVGGGFPANSKRAGNNYDLVTMLNDLSTFLSQYIDPKTTNIFFEPGRFLCEDSGYLISRISHFKTREDRSIGICDAGVNMVSSIRSWQHSAEVLNCGLNPIPTDIYGSNCFESDIIWRNLLVDQQALEQFIIIRGCGGYDIPSSNFWLRLPIPVYAIADGIVRKIRVRPPIEQFRCRDVTNG